MGFVNGFANGILVEAQDFVINGVVCSACGHVTLTFTVGTPPFDAGRDFGQTSDYDDSAAG